MTETLTLSEAVRLFKPAWGDKSRVLASTDRVIEAGETILLGEKQEMGWDHRNAEAYPILCSPYHGYWILARELKTLRLVKEA